MLATAGGLVFSGGTADRKFHAFDAVTGKLLWEFPLSSGVEAPPSSFSVNGKQYIAVMPDGVATRPEMSECWPAYSPAKCLPYRMVVRYGSLPWRIISDHSQVDFEPGFADFSGVM